MKDRSRSGIPQRWWEEGPLRIIELEEGYPFGRKMQLLRELEANAEHLTRFADPSIFPGVAFIDDRELFFVFAHPQSNWSGEISIEGKFFRIDKLGSVINITAERK
jgi:hypothetical protein